ncbi:MAG: hypothetical protein ACR2MY_00405 [Candidatus Dormibacteria bacterium]
MAARPRPSNPLLRALFHCRRWLTTYDLGSDEKIRRFTGAR